MIELSGTAKFFQSPADWHFPNPTRSFVLCDPHLGQLVFGCWLELLDGDERIVPGACGPATVRLVADQLPPLTGPLPIWNGRVLGQFLDAAVVDSS